MRKVEDNNNITHNTEKRRFMHNNLYMCVCSQNCYSVKAEGIRVNDACYF